MAEGIGFSGIDFSGKDAWRMFKIMSEFVEGFDELQSIEIRIISARTRPSNQLGMMSGIFFITAGSLLTR